MERTEYYCNKTTVCYAMHAFKNNGINFFLCLGIASVSIPLACNKQIKCQVSIFITTNKFNWNLLYLLISAWQE